VQTIRVRPRVLGAWVRSHLKTAREDFERKTTVQDRQIHVDAPVVLDGELVADPVQALRRTFARPRSCTLIVGEGGSGKTSLACRIARLVMADDASQRPTKHLMLPVLIEHELRVGSGVPDPFLSTIRGQLQALTGSERPHSFHGLWGIAIPPFCSQSCTPST
jgi:hypothetical protein